eukprot:3686685-Rhodomonas_salina.1
MAIRAVLLAVCVGNAAAFAPSSFLAVKPASTAGCVVKNSMRLRNARSPALQMVLYGPSFPSFCRPYSSLLPPPDNKLPAAGLFDALKELAMPTEVANMPNMAPDVAASAGPLTWTCGVSEIEDPRCLTVSCCGEKG